MSRLDRYAMRWVALLEAATMAIAPRLARRLSRRITEYIVRRVELALGIRQDELNIEDIIRQVIQEQPGLLFPETDPRAHLIRKALEEDLAFSLKTSVESQAVKIIRKILDEGLFDQQNWFKLASDHGRSYYWIERIVRTSFTKAANQAALQSYQAAGFTHVRWVTARDHRVRGRKPEDQFDHYHMDGKVVPIGQPFRTPRGHLLRFPGDRSLGAPPGEWINCRCTLIPITLDDQAPQPPKTPLKGPGGEGGAMSLPPSPLSPVIEPLKPFERPNNFHSIIRAVDDARFAGAVDGDPFARWPKLRDLQDFLDWIWVGMSPEDHIVYHAVRAWLLEEKTLPGYEWVAETIRVRLKRFKARWERFVGIVPKKLRLYRGVTMPIRDIARIAELWRDNPNGLIPVLARTLSSWTLRLETAVDFTSPNGLIYAYDFPVEQTFADIITDDSGFLQYMREEEVVVINVEPLYIPAHSVILARDKRLYRYPDYGPIVEGTGERGAPTRDETAIAYQYYRRLGYPMEYLNRLFGGRVVEISLPTIGRFATDNPDVHNQFRREK